MHERRSDAVRYACDIIAEDVCGLVEGLLEEAGCDGVFYSVQNAEITRFTYDEYRNGNAKRQCSWRRPIPRALYDSPLLWLGRG